MAACDYYNVAKFYCNTASAEFKEVTSLPNYVTYDSRDVKSYYKVLTVLSRVPICEVREVNYYLKNYPASLPKCYSTA